MEIPDFLRRCGVQLTVKVSTAADDAEDRARHRGMKGPLHMELTEVRCVT
jgi:hypothetical protein